MTSDGERQYVSRYSQPTFSLSIFDGQQPWSAYDTVLAQFYSVVAGVRASSPLWERTVDPVDEPGVYKVTLSSVDTETPGDYELRFSYELSGAQAFAYDLEVGLSAPYYDNLPTEWAGLVDNVWWKFADLFDSPNGGTFLATLRQTRFTRNRIAQMLPEAVSPLNSATMGHTTFEVGGAFNFKDWGYLLQRSLYIETVKHLIRSYVEQPEIVLGTTVSRTDRRDYMQRWQEILNLETDDFRRDLGRYKMANIGLGNVSVLVSGGAYGDFGPYAIGGAGEAAARGYFAVRRVH